MGTIKNLISITAVIVTFIGLLCLFLILAGLRPFILNSASMEPVYRKGSLCWVNTRASLDSLGVGDVLVYRSPTNTLVMHRLIAKTETYGKDTSAALPVIMKGDAGNMEQRISLNRINYIGKEVFTIPGIGIWVGYLLSKHIIWYAVILFFILACIPWESNSFHNKESKRSLP